MKANLRAGREIVVTTPDKLGVLSRISKIITDSGVNVEAICAYVTDGAAHLRLITDNNEKARDALSKAGFDSRENGVTIAEVSPHSIHPEIAPFVENIQPGDHYWCAAEHNGEHALIVFSLKESVRLAYVE
jgi:hypothetical protein